MEVDGVVDVVVVVAVAARHLAVGRDVEVGLAEDGDERDRVRLGGGRRPDLVERHLVLHRLPRLRDAVDEDGEVAARQREGGAHAVAELLLDLVARVEGDEDRRDRDVGPVVAAHARHVHEAAEHVVGDDDADGVRLLRDEHLVRKVAVGVRARVVGGAAVEQRDAARHLVGVGERLARRATVLLRRVGGGGPLRVDDARGEPLLRQRRPEDGGGERVLAADRVGLVDPEAGRDLVGGREQREGRVRLRAEDGNVEHALARRALRRARLQQRVGVVDQDQIALDVARAPLVVGRVRVRVGQRHKHVGVPLEDGEHHREVDGGLGDEELEVLVLVRVHLLLARHAVLQDGQRVRAARRQREPRPRRRGDRHVVCAEDAKVGVGVPDVQPLAVAAAAGARRPEEVGRRRRVRRVHVEVGLAARERRGARRHLQRKGEVGVRARDVELVLRHVPRRALDDPRLRHAVEEHHLVGAPRRHHREGRRRLREHADVEDALGAPLAPPGVGGAHRHVLVPRPRVERRPLRRERVGRPRVRRDEEVGVACGGVRRGEAG